MVIKKQEWESYNLPDVLNVKLPVSLTIGCSGKNIVLQHLEGYKFPTSC